MIDAKHGSVAAALLFFDVPIAHVAEPLTANAVRIKDGDTVLLIDPAGVVRSRVEDTGEQVGASVWVEFGVVSNRQVRS